MSSDQMTLLGIFGEGLDPTNRWMKLARSIPRDEIALRYPHYPQKGHAVSTQKGHAVSILVN